jgi:hypothetical protein
VTLAEAPLIARRYAQQNGEPVDAHQNLQRRFAHRA